MHTHGQARGYPLSAVSRLSPFHRRTKRLTGGREDGEPRLRSPPRSGQTQIAAAVDQVGDPCAQPGLEPCACPEARRRAVAGSLTRAGRDYLAQRPREGRTFSCSDPAWDGGMPPRGSWRRPGGPQRGVGRQAPPFRRSGNRSTGRYDASGPSNGSGGGSCSGRGYRQPGRERCAATSLARSNAVYI